MADLIVALGVSSKAEVAAVLARLGDAIDFYKIGLELFSAEGPDVVKLVKDAGKRVFLDLKLHDIPRTVERAVKSGAGLGVDLMTIHATGGKAMIRAAADAAAGCDRSWPRRCRSRMALTSASCGRSTFRAGSPFSSGVSPAVSTIVFRCRSRKNAECSKNSCDDTK